MNRRAFLLSAAAAALPLPALADIPRKRGRVKMALLWLAHDVDALKISLIYEDGTTVVTMIPFTWLFEHPIESKLLSDYFFGSTRPENPVYIALCEGVVEEYIHGL